MSTTAQRCGLPEALHFLCGKQTGHTLSEKFRQKEDSNVR